MIETAGKFGKFGESSVIRQTKKATEILAYQWYPYMLTTNAVVNLQALYMHVH